MIDVTNAAQEQVSEYFKGREIQPIRIFLNQGCGGPQLAMALDQKTDADEAFEFGGVEYIMESTLMNQASPVKVDYTGMGFSLTSSLKLSSGCGSCGTKGSCCS
ncbi:MAG: IscA/HesB family protein [Pseudomonadota bacterium]